jgi:micrococcal nuclease
VTPIRKRFAVLLGAVALAGCGDSPCGPDRGVVARVIDGDTIELEGGLRVRYLDVDCPEDTHVVECFGEEARLANESRVLGREVLLQYESRCEDDYGRLLAHVLLDGRVVGRDLVAEGYGCALVIEPNTLHGDEFREAQAWARAHGLGLWGACRDDLPCR